MNGFVAPLGARQLGVEVLVDIARQQLSGLLTFRPRGQAQTLTFRLGRPVAAQNEAGRYEVARVDVVSMVRAFATQLRGDSTFVAEGPSATLPVPALQPPIDTLGEALVAATQDLGSSQLDVILAARGLLPLQVTPSFDKLVTALERCGGVMVPAPPAGSTLLQVTADVEAGVVRSYVVLHLFGGLRAAGHSCARFALPAPPAAKAPEMPAAGSYGEPSHLQPGTMAHDIHVAFARHGSQDHYSFLQVGRDASASQVRKAYFDLAKRWHSDRLQQQGLDETTLKMADGLFRRAEEAHKMLSDAQARSGYDWMLERQAKGLPTDPMVVLEAEGLFQRGEALLRRGNARGALEALEKAIQLNPGEPEFLAFYGFALFGAQGKSGREKALQNLHKALAARSDMDTAHEFLGSIAHAEGDLAVARQHLQRACELKPQNTHAQRELRLVMARMEQESKKPEGFLHRFRKP